MTDRLGELELKRALLARQQLLERSSMRLVEMVEQVGGLQTQYAPSGYIGLWSRLQRFRRADLTRALEQRAVVQATMMRATIHVVSAADYWPLTIAIRRTRQEWFERVSRRDIESLDMSGAAAAASDELRGGPLRMAELTERLGARGFPERAARWVGMYVDLVRVPPSGTWEHRRADLYGLAEEWIGPPVPQLSEQDGIDYLVRRYLGAFGPAPLADIGSWAGLPPTLLKPSVERLGLAELGGAKPRRLYDLPELAGQVPPAGAPAPVRFLPTWDALLLVHARRTQVLPEPFRPKVFNTRTPQSVPTFMVDGQVAGTWRYAKGEISLEPFDKLPRPAMAELREEAARLAAFHSE
jgi:hypothetical protein